MSAIIDDLQTKKKSLAEFADITIKVIGHLKGVITSKETFRDYIILKSKAAGTEKFVRPINKNLFIEEVGEFEENFMEFEKILNKIKNKHKLPEDAYNITDNVVYTMLQSVGAGLDLLVNPNSARKHLGNRFEEMIRLIISQIGVSNKKVVFKIPYPTDEGEKMYSCETDIIISPYDNVKSNPKSINKKEVIISLKTSSKDRMGKIFLDKILMERFVKHPVKVIGIFFNDVQRKEEKYISYTFVSGLFMVYTKFLSKLEGVYFVDIPQKAKESPYNNYIFPFSKFLIDYISKFLPS